MACSSSSNRSVRSRLYSPAAGCSRRRKVILVTPYLVVLCVICVYRASKHNARRFSVAAELLDAALCSRPEELLQKNRTKAEALPSVLYDQTDVGRGRLRGRAIARHADQVGFLPRADLRHECHPFAIVDVGNGLCFLRAQSTRGKEPLIDRARAQPLAQRHQARRVIRADRAEVDRGTIAQDDDPVNAGGESLDSSRLSASTHDPN